MRREGGGGKEEGEERREGIHRLIRLYCRL